MSTTTSEAVRVRPVPPQTSQGSATTRPVPSHSGHSISMTPMPKMEPRSTEMRPRPPQVGQVSECSASTEPVPWQWSQAAYRW